MEVHEHSRQRTLNSSLVIEPRPDRLANAGNCIFDGASDERLGPASNASVDQLNNVRIGLADCHLPSARITPAGEAQHVALDRPPMARDAGSATQTATRRKEVGVD